MGIERRDDVSYDEITAMVAATLDIPADRIQGGITLALDKDGQTIHLLTNAPTPLDLLITLSDALAKVLRQMHAGSATKPEWTV